METIDYKQAFIKTLLEYEEDLCSLCQNDYRKICNDKCTFFAEGKGLHDEQGKYYDWKWSCHDFDFADCPGLENTPCKKCVMNKFSEEGFKLDESKVLDYLKKLGK